MSNDFTLSNGGRTIELHSSSDIDDCESLSSTPAFIRTSGLVAVGRYLRDEEVFLANYSDGLSDVPIDSIIGDFRTHDAIASFVAVRTWQSFHTARFDKSSYVTGLGVLNDTDFWINGGFFVLRNEAFDYIDDGDELIEQPSRRLIEKRKLRAYLHTGYWRAMDTFKDKIGFDRGYAHGNTPWEVWRRRSP